MRAIATMRSTSALRVCAALGIALALAAGPAPASSGEDIRFEPAPSNGDDVASLQRGARIFVNYCLGCHTARYMRYNRLTDIGLTEAQIKDNLMFASDKIGETMSIGMSARDIKAWFDAPPPDLTVEARVRGKEWLYNYFLGFYRDSGTATGWNNLVFHNVGMPHVLWTQSGIWRLDEQEFEDADKAHEAAIAAKRLVAVEPIKGGRYAVKTLVQETPGALTPDQYRDLVADLANYLDFMAEPVRAKRVSIGIGVLLFLGVLFVFAYALKREYWKDVH